MADEVVKKVRKRNDIKGTGQNWRKGKLKRTPDEVREAFKEYTQYCEGNKRRPTWEGFAGYLDITSETLMTWLKATKEDDSYNPEMSEVLKKVGDWFTDSLQQKNDSMTIFLLKQPRYGGYSDRPAVDVGASVKLDVTIKGVDGAFE